MRLAAITRSFVVTAALLAVHAQAAVTIVGWTNRTCSATMNPPYGGTTWNLPIYTNQVDIGIPGASGSNTALVVSNSAHWTSNNTYVLRCPIKFVAPAVLTIDPGTVVRFWPWTDPNVTLPGSLTISAGAKIVARGTAKDPIIFTDMWDNNVPGMTPGLISGNGGSSAPGAPSPFFKVGPALLIQGERDYSKWQPTFGYWGGIQIVGRTPVTTDNSCTNAVKTVPSSYIEGLPNSPETAYGNGPLDDDDCSGVFTYCSIRYNGFPLAANKELNGLSLYGVGRETEIHHVETMNAYDDGVEWFGGSVNTKYLVVWACGDDCFDSDEGYRGKSQFDFAVQGAVLDICVKADGSWDRPVVGSGWGDKGMEIDSGTANEMGVPLALSQWYNLTIIGKGTTNGISTLNLNWTDRTSDQVDANTAILCRDAAAPQVRNSVFTEFRGAGVAIEARNDKLNNGFAFDCLDNAKRDWNVFPANTNTVLNNSAIYQAQSDGKQLEIKNCVFHKLGGALSPTTTNALLRAGGYEQSSTPAPLHLDGYSAYTGGASIDVDFSTASYSNILASTSPIGHCYRDMNTNSGTFAKNVFAVTNVNPCAANDAVAGAPLPPADGFYSPVTYKGAFSPNYNWMAGWTCADRMGLIDTSMNVAGTDGTSASVISVIGPYPSIKFSTDDGGIYQVEGTTNMTTWVALGQVKGNGGESWYVDQSGKAFNALRVVHVK